MKTLLFARARRSATTILVLLALTAVGEGPARGQSMPEVIDINEGRLSSNPKFFTGLGGILYFSADDGVSGRELWSYDPATGQAQLVDDIFPGSSSALPAPVSGNSIFPYPVYEDAIYFAASDGASRKLWRYDGTSATRFAEPLDDDTFSPEHFTTFNGELVFALDLDGGLWRYDGSAISQIPDPCTAGCGNYAGGYAEFDGKLYTTSLIRELMSYDGTEVRTETEIDPSGPALNTPTEIVVFQNALYFPADDGSGGTEVWSYDGTSAAQITDIDPGGDANPQHLTVFGDQLCFAAENPDVGRELWCYDGTATTLYDINPGPSSGQPTALHISRSSSVRPFPEYDGKLYFAAVGDEIFEGNELWSFDGRAPALAADINPSGSSLPKYFVLFDGRLYFEAQHGTYGKELWSYDGVDATLVADIRVGSGSSNPHGMTVVDGALYFAAIDGITDSDNGNELWRLAGSNAPPIAVDDEATTAEEVPVDIDVLANDSDPDGDPLTIANFTQPTNGQATDAGGGRLTYSPDIGFTGSDSFTYTAADGNGGTASATVSMNVASGTLVLAVSETIGISDAPMLLPAVRLAIDESIAVTDEPNLLLPLLLSVAESIAVTDAAALLPAVRLAIEESIAVTDDPSLILPLVVSVTETVAVTDAANLRPALALAIQESIAVNDDPDFAAALLLRIQELIAVSDTFGALLGVDGLIYALEASVENLFSSGALTSGQAKSQLRKLGHIRKHVEHERYNVALNVLTAFVDQVEAFREEDSLTEEQAGALLAQAQALATAIAQLMDPAHSVAGASQRTDEGVMLPVEYALAPSYPNPFNSRTIIPYALPEAVHVRLEVFDALGRSVTVLIDREQEAGNYAMSFDDIGLASGVYLYQLTAGSFMQTRTMTLVD